MPALVLGALPIAELDPGLFIRPLGMRLGKGHRHVEVRAASLEGGREDRGLSRGSAALTITSATESPVAAATIACGSEASSWRDEKRPGSSSPETARRARSASRSARTMWSKNIVAPRSPRWRILRHRTCWWSVRGASDPPSRRSRSDGPSSTTWLSRIATATEPGARFGTRGSRSLLVPPTRRPDPQAIVAAARETGADVIVNAADPRLNPPIFSAAFEARCTYLDMAMTLSEPHPERPYEEPGVKLGDRQFAEHERWQNAGLLALLGMGVEPGLSDVFARYAADHLFSRSTRSMFAMGQISSSRATPSPRRSRSGRRSRSVSIRHSSGSASAAGTRRSRSPSQRSSTSRRGSARSNA